MAEIGNSLREARIRKGLSTKDVEDRTKVRRKYIEALENDDFEVLPGPTYVKAFLRTYATFLKLDADALVTEYRSTYRSEREELPAVRREPLSQPKARARSRSRSTGSRPSRGPLEGDKKRSGSQRRSPRGYALVAFLAIVVVIALAWYSADRGHNKATLDTGITTTLTSSTSTSLIAPSGGTGGSSTSSSIAATTSSSGARTETTSAGATAQGGNVSLKIQVNTGSCWLVIHENSSSGAELYAGTLSAGGQLTFDSSQAYWMTLGAPEVLTVFINGRSSQVAGAPGSFLVTETGIAPST